MEYCQQDGKYDPIKCILKNPQLIPQAQFIIGFLVFHSKWKADRAAVTSLCVSPDGKLLLSAGQVIKMWDLDTKEVYRVSVFV